MWSSNPKEPLKREIRRRTHVVGTFPDRAFLMIRLVGPILAETHDEWTEIQRYVGLGRGPELATLPSLVRSGRVEQAGNEDGQSNAARRPALISRCRSATLALYEC